MSETRSQTSRKSKTLYKSSVGTIKSIRIGAVAKAAELETKLKYLKPLQEQEAALEAREADITRLKLEKELHVAKARQAVSETDSTEDYDSMLDNLPTDTDKVQQYRRDNAMTPLLFVPTTTTTYGQDANAIQAGMTTRRHPSVFARRWTSAKSCRLSSGFGGGLYRTSSSHVSSRVGLTILCRGTLHSHVW